MNELNEMRQELRNIEKLLNEGWNKGYSFWDTVDREFSDVKAVCANAFRRLESIDKRLNTLIKNQKDSNERHATTTSKDCDSNGIQKIQ
ncbi:hypothetical protein [Methylobacter sp.]|uniref:hypothetical protein n=1 Tax=Methylobacter sp. TaxID=2051955 RepID=UPI003DA22655